MRKSFLNIVSFVLLAVAFSAAYSVQAQVRAYRVSDRQMRILLSRIEVRTDNFNRELNSALDTSSINGTSSEDAVNSYVSAFENATDNLRRKFDSRTDVSADVREVLSRAAVIQGVLRDYPLTSPVQRQWSLLRTDLNTLASYYNIRGNWNNPVGNNGNQFNTMLTGTYRLNVNQSDNVSNVIDRALNTNIDNTNQAERIHRNLERRLASPNMLVIEKLNNQVTIASDMADRVTFAADGIARTETNPNGRTVNTKATTLSSGLEISYQGDRVNDFFVTFMPMNNGQLKVTRRIYLENRNETVTVNSFYDKVSQTADYTMVNRNSTVPSQSSTVSNDFLIPNGTPVTAILSSRISTQTAVDGDRFTMEVTSPSQYNGAVIEGYVSNTTKSGRVSGRAQATFNFDTIRLRNGGTYRFSGIIDQVRQSNGDAVNVNNEGVVRDSNQTTRTVTRTGIGGALGAIIGAIVGGGQGAAIGAGVGAGAGAGTVILQGRDNLELQSGSEFRITSSAPANVTSSR